MAHISRVYDEVGKMMLVLDRAPWHKSIAVQEFLAQRDIIIMWYPVGHPYLNPVGEVWSVLKGSVDRSIRYADVKSHLTAIFNHVKKTNGFDYDFAVFWRRRQPRGVMRPIARVEGDLDPRDIGPKSAVKPAQKPVPPRQVCKIIRHKTCHTAFTRNVLPVPQLPPPRPKNSRVLCA